MDRADKLALLTRLAAGTHDLAVKGKAMPYLAVNGNMFAFLGGDDVLAFRLSEPDRAAFETAHGPVAVRQYGSVMRGYVGLPDIVLNDTAATETLFHASVAFARSLKSKPTKR